MKYEYPCICKVCKKTFTAKHPSAKYCSEECFRKVYPNGVWKREHRNYKPKKCLECGKEFTPKSKIHKFCSKECRNKAWERKNPNYFNSETSWWKLRFEVFQRDNFTCQYCGRNVLEDGVKLEVDHLNPKSKGGLFEMDNLVTACKECNQGKKDVCLEKHQREKLKGRWNDNK